MMHHPPIPTFQQPPQREKYGVFLEKLPAFITDEILYSQCKKLKLEGYTFVKVPREYNSKVSQGYAFIYFDTFENAKNARKEFNSKGIYKDKIRAALLVDRPKESSESNFILTNIPLDVEIGQLDELLSKYGTVVSSRIDMKNDGKTSKGIGYVRFYKNEDAQKFKAAAEQKEITINGSTIEAMVFKQNVQQATEKKNLFFKDFKRTYTREQLENDEFVTAQREQIITILKEKLGKFGEIASSIVTFNENLLQPFAFVCFKNTEDATNALEEVNKDEEFPFQYRNWALSKAQMLKQRQNSKKFLYIKHLKPTVTQEKLYKILSGILKISSVQVRTPKLASIKTKYATVMTEEENKKEFLYNSLNPSRAEFFNKDFSECFDKKVYVNYLYPLQQHKNWMKKNLGRRFYGSKMNTNAQPVQINQQMMMMQQFFQMQQMRMMQQQQMPPMQMPPPGMQPNPPMGYPQAPVNYPPPGLGHQQQHGGRPHHMRPNFNKPQRPYNQQRQHHHHQQPRRDQQERYQNQNNNQHNNQNNNNNNNQQYQQQRGRQQQNQQPKQVYQPKAVQPKPVSQQQQQKAQNQITIESIKSKWEDFQKLGKDRQQHMFGVLFYPKVQKIAKSQAQVPKITGILTDLSSLDIEEVRDMYEDEEEFVERVREAEELLEQAE